MYSIVTSEAFKISVQRFKAFLTYKYSDDFASETLFLIKQNIQNHLSAAPELAPISPRLLDIGITDYRQWSIDKHNLVFYKIEHTKKEVQLLALMDSRQNIQKLLLEVMLIS